MGGVATAGVLMVVESVSLAVSCVKMRPLN